RVVDRVDGGPHVPLDDLGDPDASYVGPACCGGEHPGHLTTGLLERHLMGVERPGEAEVVQHRCDVQQIEVDLEIRVVCIDDAPQVGANAVRVQRREAVAAGNLVRCDCRHGVWTRQLVQVH